MEADELRQRRKAAGLTQAQLGKRLGLHRDFIGLMERGVQPIAERTALAVAAISPSLPRPEDAAPPLQTTDPMEQIVERALQRAGIRYEPDRGKEAALDFYLPDQGVHIEVKRFHSERIAKQMARAPNVIAVQGEASVRFLASAIEAMASP